jgi:hypothetical protein
MLHLFIQQTTLHLSPGGLCMKIIKGFDVGINVCGGKKNQ